MTDYKVKTKVDITTDSSAQAGIDTVSKGSMITMGVVSALVGIWAVACLVSAIAEGGPIELIKGWFTAVLGV